MEEVSLWSYLIKVLGGLLVLGAAGALLVRALPRLWRLNPSGGVAVLSVTPVGRDLVYVLKMGPTVVAVISSPKGGFEVLHRWEAEEFERHVERSGDTGGGAVEP
ncbi:MAG: hypothetical protein N2315_04455 [Thermanaerothrix sp.]|nr:hypothetical protein [Thermanaerothrix sp.]